MKYIIAIFTICSILGKDIYQASWDIWYVVNKEYVAQELCENQDTPMLDCNGKCYLAKQLEKAESKLKDLEQNHKNNRPVIAEGMKIAQTIEIQAVYEILPSSKEGKCFYLSDKSYSFNYLNRIDHPPQS